MSLVHNHTSLPLCPHVDDYGTEKDYEKRKTHKKKKRKVSVNNNFLGYYWGGGRGAQGFIGTGK